MGTAEEVSETSCLLSGTASEVLQFPRNASGQEDKGRPIFLFLYERVYK